MTEYLHRNDMNMNISHLHSSLSPLYPSNRHCNIDESMKFTRYISISGDMYSSIVNRLMSIIFADELKKIIGLGECKTGDMQIEDISIGGIDDIGFFRRLAKKFGKWRRTRRRKKTFREIRKAKKGWFSIMKKNIRKLKRKLTFRSIGKTFKKVAGRLKNAAKKLSDAIISKNKNKFKKAFRYLKNTAKQARRIGGKYVKSAKNLITSTAKTLGTVPMSIINAARGAAAFASSKAKQAIKIAHDIGAKAVDTIKKGFEWVYNKTIKPLVDKVNGLFNRATFLNNKIQQSGNRSPAAVNIMNRFNKIASRYNIVQKMLHALRLSKGKSVEIQGIGDIGVPPVLAGAAAVVVGALTVLIATISSFIKSAEPIAEGITSEGMPMPPEATSPQTITPITTPEGTTYLTPTGQVVQMTPEQAKEHELPPPEAQMQAQQLMQQAKLAMQSGRYDLAKIYQTQAMKLMMPRKKKNIIFRILDKKIFGIVSIKWILIGIIVAAVLVKLYPYVKPHVERLYRSGRERLEEFGRRASAF